MRIIITIHTGDSLILSGDLQKIQAFRPEVFNDNRFPAERSEQLENIENAS